MRKSYIDEECNLGCLERLVEEYIEQEDYKYKFDFEFSNNHDVETSILSKMIFMRLLEIDKMLFSTLNDALLFTLNDAIAA